MKKTGRNEPCYCSSGIKYKRCCLNKAVQVKPPSKLTRRKPSGVALSMFTAMLAVAAQPTPPPAGRNE